MKATLLSPQGRNMMPTPKNWESETDHRKEQGLLCMDFLISFSTVIFLNNKAFFHSDEGVEVFQYTEILSVSGDSQQHGST